MLRGSIEEQPIEPALIVLTRSLGVPVSRQ
jgi:hypothetical protein